VFSRDHILAGLMLIAAIIFVSAVAQLFAVGVSTGTAYPEYSSFRTDPLGVRAFSDALESLGGVTLRRNIEPLTKIGGGKDRTLFLCGASTSKDPEDVLTAIETFVADGGRFAVLFFPQGDETKRIELQKELEKKEEEEKREREEKAGGDTPEDETSEEASSPVKAEAEPVLDTNDDAAPGVSPASPDDGKDRAPWETRFVSCEKRWGFKYAYAKLPGADDEAIGEVTVTRVVDDAALPPSMAWHSSLCFSELAPEWRTLYAWANHPVVVERSWGRGTIVLASDSYPVSNEAMWKDRHAGFLAWLAGASREVVFDETHLGTQRVRGTMMMIREYRLAGLVIVAAAIGLLFIWRNAASLVPKHEAASTGLENIALGKGASEALVDLLRRSVPKRDVLRVCVDEWARSASLNPRHSNVKEKRIRAVVGDDSVGAPSENETIAGYQSICRILAEKEQHRERGS